MINTQDLIKIKNYLKDEKSKKIFDARFQFGIYRDEFKFFDSVKEEKYYSRDFEEFYKKEKERKIIIYGIGGYGIYTFQILKLCGYKIEAFCDNNRKKWGGVIEGIPIISPHQLLKQKGNSIIVIASRNYIKEIYEQLLWIGIDRKNIYYPSRGFMYAISGWQYFDFFVPKDKEIFVDAGSYDASTSIEFTKWTNNNYEKIYIFEANIDNENLCKEKLHENGIKNYELIMKGTWNKEEKLYFNNTDTTGSRIEDSGNIRIETISIDRVLDGRKATFIKMDVEGSEYKSILGAKETIKKYKPRLAISVYHRPEDFVEIPSLLLKINPEYNFAFRHYTTYIEETVLYAW